MRASLRENDVMRAFSQLAKFASDYRQPPWPGLEIIETPRYRIQLAPDFPIPGPNSVAWIRCDAAEADDVIREVQATVAERGLKVAWTLDPGTQPADFDARLAAHGIMPQADGEAAVMILPTSAHVDVPVIGGLAIRNALEDLDTFTASERVATEAFAGVPFGEPSPIGGQIERRFANHRATPGRHHLLATVDGEPAGAGSVTVMPPDGAAMNGGSVRPRFRGTGVYRALVVARLDLAREAGAAGLFVWAGHMSAPILERIGFQHVSWRRSHV